MRQRAQLRKCFFMFSFQLTTTGFYVKPLPFASKSLSSHQAKNGRHLGGSWKTEGRKKEEGWEALRREKKEKYAKSLKERKYS